MDRRDKAGTAAAWPDPAAGLKQSLITSHEQRVCNIPEETATSLGYPVLAGKV